MLMWLREILLRIKVKLLFLKHEVKLKVGLKL
jgi:hypothetical protein